MTDLVPRRLGGDVDRQLSLVNFEHEHDESSQAGYVMLAMSEAGTIAVMIAFMLIAGAAGSLDFAAIAAALARGRRRGWLGDLPAVVFWLCG